MSLLAGPRGRRLTFAALYACEGAPIGLIWWTLPTLLSEQGMAVERVTALSATLTLPWVFKFAWAPLVDLARESLGGLRPVVIGAQVLMGLFLLPLIWLDPALRPGLVVAVLLAHALAAATQDVAIDAWALQVTPASERGRLNGAMQAGMLIGRWAFGAGALLLGSRLDLPGIIAVLVVLLWSGTLLVVRAGPVETAAPAEAESGAAEAEAEAVAEEAPRGQRGPRPTRDFGRAFARALRRRSTWLGLAFALLGGAGFEAVGALAGPYLVERGASRESIGFFYSLSVVLMLGGALLGGRLADRLGHRRTAAWALLFLFGAIVLLASTEAWSGGAPPALAIAVLSPIYFGIGAFTTASYALFMDLTEDDLEATQFSAFMGATNACEAWSARLGGLLAASRGHATAFAVLAALSLLALLPLGALRSVRPPRQSG